MNVVFYPFLVCRQEYYGSHIVVNEAWKFPAEWCLPPCHKVCQLFFRLLTLVVDTLTKVIQ